MTTLSSVAAVAAAETLASMTKGSQLCSVTDPSMTPTSNKVSILDEASLQNSKGNKANGTSFQPIESMDTSRMSRLDKDESSKMNNNCPVMEILETEKDIKEKEASCTSINGLSSIAGDEKKGII